MFRVSTITTMDEVFTALAKNATADMLVMKQNLCYLYACTDFVSHEPLTITRVSDVWSFQHKELPVVAESLWRNVSSTTSKAGSILLNNLRDVHLGRDCGASAILGNRWGLLDLCRLSGDKEAFRVVFLIVGDNVEVEYALNAGIVYTLRTGRAPFESDLMPGRFSPEEED